MTSAEYKAKLLTESFGKANYRLKNALLFKYVKKAGENYCFRCGKEIFISDFSVEHTSSWQAACDPKKEFFDLDKIAFSHKLCNYSADKVVIRKKLVCKNGHRLEEGNIIWKQSGKYRCKNCKICNRLRMRTQRSENKDYGR